MNWQGKRVILVFPSWAFGGAERQGLHLARYLRDEKGACVEVWAALGEERGRTAELCDELGFSRQTLGMQWVPNRITRLRELWRFGRALRRARPDIILPYTLYPNFFCALTWRGSGAQICVWNQRDEGRDRPMPQMEKLAIRWTPLFLSNSSHGADLLIREMGAPPEKVHVVYNGVEIPDYNEAARAQHRVLERQRLDLAENDFVACMVANITSHKDHATLIRAWKIVCENETSSGIKPVLLLAGRHDNTYDECHALVQELGLESNVRFMGSVKDISVLLCAVDLGVFSSCLEGVPNGVLEVMTHGLALAATDIPGICEALGDDYPFLAPPSNAETLAKHIVRLWLDKNLRDETGQRNHGRIEHLFGLRRMREQTVAHIEQTLDKR